MKETWMIFLLPETALYAKKLIEIVEESGLKAKETCFGAIVEGDPAEVKRQLAGLRRGYPGSVYFKRRSFSIEDTEICASTFRRADESLPRWLPRYAGQIRRYTS